VTVDVRAVASGGVAAISVALPAQLLAQLLVSAGALSDTSGVLVLFALLQALGFVFGGFASGRLRPDSPLSHGALGALAGFCVVELTALLFTVIRGDDILVPRIVFYAMVSSLLGMLGGAVSQQRRTVR
jgi:putative membrane protein (TIGR04086 family)